MSFHSHVLSSSAIVLSQSPVENSPIITRKGKVNVTWGKAIKKKKSDPVDEDVSHLIPDLMKAAAYQKRTVPKLLKATFATKPIIKKPMPSSTVHQRFAQIDSFANMKGLIKKSKPTISFWGKERIVVKGYKGNLPRDCFARLALTLLKVNPEYDEAERVAGKVVAAKINKIYKLHDKQLKRKSFLTKLFVFLRSLGSIEDCFGYNTRYLWSLNRDGFDFYTKSQYIIAFGRNPPDPYCTKWEAPNT